MNPSSASSSFFFKTVERFSAKVIGLIVSFVLARLLLPEEFGMLAILMVFINLSQTLLSCGLGTALIQAKEVDDADYDAVFVISLLCSVFLVAVLWLIAPFIGAYYENEGLVLPLRIYAFSLFFYALYSVLLARVERGMEFRKEMVCSLLATVLSGALGVFMAARGYGIYALVTYYFSYSVFCCVFLALSIRWFPKLRLESRRTKALFSYGWKMLVSAVICSLYADIRSLIVGKVYSEADLGYYNRGQQIPEVISGTVDSSVTSVLFPILSKKQDHKDEVRASLSRAVSIGSMIVFPLMLGLCAAAEPFVVTLLTEKWLPSVVYLQILALGYLTVPIVSSSLVAIKATGRSDIYMKLEILRRVVMIAVLLTSVFAFHSVAAIAVGFGISSLLDAGIVSFAASRLIGYSGRDVLHDVTKSAIAAILMFGIVFSMNLLPLSAPILLLIEIAVGVAAYMAFCFLLRSEPFLELWNVCKKAIASFLKKDSQSGGKEL